MINTAKIVEDLCKKAAAAAPLIAAATTEQKNNALIFAADELLKNKAQILAANAIDLAAFPADKPASFKDRMLLNEERINLMAQGLKDIANLADPVGKVLSSKTLPSGLKIERVTVPLGVLCVIFEARPNVCADAAALCLKAGSSIILRGGGDSLNSVKAIYDCLQKGMARAGLSADIINLVPLKEREAVDELLKQDKYIDVIIPRGGKSLVEKVSQSKIPTFKHLDGICHTYIHSAAQTQMAKKVLLNAKLRRTGICGATETVLLDADLKPEQIKDILNVLVENGCEVRADAKILKIMPFLKPAFEADWATEYLAPIISAKIVSGVKEAVAHIRQYGSSHTEAIITDDAQAAEDFLNTVDSAVVMHNTSTQFCDGGEFGMGAEIGIATGRLHARGPVGLEQLVTFKYKVRGNGETRK